MKQRVITGIIFGLVVLGLLLFSEETRLVLLVLVPLLSFWEFTRLTEFKPLDYLISLIIILAFSALCYYTGETYRTALIFGLVAINSLLLINLFTGFLNFKKTKVILGTAYIVLPFILAVFFEWQVPVYILFSAMVLIWVSDSAAYFVGSQLGKRKLFPSISPKKTWEGLWGACMISLLAAFVLHSYFQEGTWRAWVCIGLVVWGLGAIGDLIASQFKRYFSVKDSGSLLPGHGGFYDRFDAFIFILPFLILLVEHFNIL